jgi:large subunit ribosomal protein L18
MAEKKGKNKLEARARRERRTRSKIYGTAARPRLSIYRSLTNIFAQVIDDEQGRTLVSASTIDKELAGQLSGKNKSEAAKLVGELVGKRATAAGIEFVVFDRGGFRYQGRVAALATGARESGLKF